jgi:hypothetical protein
LPLAVVGRGFAATVMRVVLGLAVGGGAVGGGAGCGSNTASVDLGAGGGSDGAVFQECSSICLRPGDCAIAYPDGSICPPGFLCALRFMCRD